VTAVSRIAASLEAGREAGEFPVVFIFGFKRMLSVFPSASILFDLSPR
jgi:hypothetical protein